MKIIPDDVKITGINIPATHDSAACFASFSLISRTQSLTVAEQLNAGVRFFDFRFSLENGEFFAKHGIANCKKSKGLFAPKLTADEIVAHCIDFVKSNPTETVLFVLRDTTGSKNFFSEFYSRYIENNSSMWYLNNSIPLLGEVRGKIVLLRNVNTHSDMFNDTNSGINFRPPYVGSTYVDDWKTGELCSIETGKAFAKVHIQDSYKVEGKKKWGTVKRFLESDLNSDDFNVCAASCTGIRTPYFNAKYINSELMKFTFNKDKCYGIVMMDFVTAELCDKIIESNTDDC
ncbi:MAG: hypothetical protein IJZ35_02755 [Clostridia bacterium]|nr:hypothetical protein [Clostridia bacterium]